MKHLNQLILILLSLSLLLFGCSSQEAPETTATPTTSAPETSEETLPPAAQTAMVLTKITYMDGSGTETRHIEYEYDDSGFCTAQREISAQGETGWEQKNTAGDNGLVAMTEYYSGGTLTGYTIYTYNSDGQVAKEEMYEGSKIIQTTQYVYDAQGNVSEMEFTADGITQNYSFVRTYDEAGNVLTLEESLDGSLVSRTEMTYDEAGRCTLSVACTADGIVTGSTESIWEDLTETRFYYDADDVAYQTSVITYDEYGNVTFQEDTYTGGSVSMTEYTYATIEILQ